MVHRLLAMAFVLALVQPTTASAQRAADPERAAVQRVIVTLAEHIQSGDLAAIDSLFPPRGVHILTNDATTHGWAEYRDRHLVPELASWQGLRYAHTAVEAVVRENVSWVAFRRELAGEAAGSEAQGRGTAVLEKVDGRWLIVHLHMSR